MMSHNGRSAFGALAPALLLPAAAPAQCQHMGQSQQPGGQMALPMSQTGMMRSLTPRMSLLQTQQMQLIAMQQMQLIAMQQMQLPVIEQQVLMAQQLQLMAQRPGGMPLVQPQPAPGLLTAQPMPPLSPTQQKQYGALLREMTALQQRLETLEQAGQRDELRPQQATDAQHEVNAMWDRVDAVAKVPDAVLERMSALRDLSDELLRQVSAKPADLIAAARGGR